MTWLAMMIGEWLLTLMIQRWFDRPRVSAPMPANDDEPVHAERGSAPTADYWRVYEDLEEIEALLASGRASEAHDAVAKLLDVMDGRDEAAATDARWVEIRRAA